MKGTIQVYFLNLVNRRIVDEGTKNISNDHAAEQGFFFITLLLQKRLDETPKKREWPSTIFFIRNNNHGQKMFPHIN